MSMSNRNMYWEMVVSASTENCVKRELVNGASVDSVDHILALSVPRAPCELCKLLNLSQTVDRLESRMRTDMINSLTVSQQYFIKTNGGVRGLLNSVEVCAVLPENEPLNLSKWLESGGWKISDLVVLFRISQPDVASTTERYAVLAKLGFKFSHLLKFKDQVPINYMCMFFGLKWSDAIETPIGWRSYDDFISECTTLSFFSVEDLVRLQFDVHDEVKKKSMTLQHLQILVMFLRRSNKPLKLTLDEWRVFNLTKQATVVLGLTSLSEEDMEMMGFVDLTE